jgi:hypothetical protein
MSQRGMLEDILGPAWSALTAEQRICWHFTAAKNPIFEEEGGLFTENGWQFFVDRNATLAVVNAAHVMSEPPTTETPPNTDPLVVAAWPLPGKLGAGGSAKRPPVTVTWGSPGPVNTDVIITQEYNRFVGYHSEYPLTERISATFTDGQKWITTGTTGEYLTTGRATSQRIDPPKKNKKPAVRHVTTWQAGDAEEISLDDPTGYYATTDGNNKFARIKGLTARRRPDLPLGRVKFINRENGETIEQTITNPTGGSTTAISRPRNFP